jgi:Ca2+-binding RTX toxin-like protein
MSSVLEFGSTVIFEATNEDGGLDIITDPNSDNFIVISEIEGEASAADPGDDIIIGGGSFDFISASAGDDIIVGRDGDDVIDGDSGSDIIRGGAGDDIIIGGKGSDLLIGGEGEDIFEFQFDDFAAGEVDNILDFETGVDRIRINGIDPSLVTVEDNQIKFDGETIISLDGTATGDTDDDTFELF